MSSRIERIVLDTNVLVSAFLNPIGAPAQVLTLLLAGEGYAPIRKWPVPLCRRLNRISTS